jgi:hypothetical protein
MGMIRMPGSEIPHVIFDFLDTPKAIVAGKELAFFHSTERALEAVSEQYVRVGRIKSGLTGVIPYGAMPGPLEIAAVRLHNDPSLVGQLPRRVWDTFQSRPYYWGRMVAGTELPVMRPQGFVLNPFNDNQPTEE